MKQFFDKSNPLGQFLKDWKKATDYKAKDYEEYIGELADKPVVTSVKIDGELILLSSDKEKTYLIGKEGRIREELPLLDEAKETLSGKNESIFIGELYGVDEEGDELPFNDTMSLIRKPPTEEAEQRIRLGIFDVVKYDGKDVSDNDYWERMLLIQEVFEDNELAHPIYAEKADGTSIIEEMWEQHIIQKDHEGLILRVDGETIKIKPTKTIDAIVIAIKPQKEEELMGSLFVALMDEVETFRTLSFIGTGFSNEERKEWYDWAIEQETTPPNDDELIWVKIDTDPRIVEINYEQANVRDTEAFTLTNAGHWSQVDDKLSATLRKASLLRIRDDKEVNKDDLRLNQIPELESKKSFLLSADIAKQDSIHPDKEIHYTYIGMVSLDEGFPLHMYFNDSIDGTTIAEPLDTFDLEKYKDRITNLDILTTDMVTVEETGISKVMKITPDTGLELHEASRTADTDLIEGQWAIYDGKPYVNPKYPDIHVEWFERIGLPSVGAAFDRITRGTFAIEGNTLYVARNAGAGSAEELLDQQNRLAEKILYITKSDKRLNDLDEYKVTALKKSFTLNAYGENTGNWAIYKHKLYADRGGKLHSLWFEDIGLPSYGEEFDQVPRGWYKVIDNDLELVVYNEGYPQHVDTLFKNEDRIVEKAKQLEGIDTFNEVQLYEVSGSAKRRVANKSFSIQAYYPKNPKTIIIPKNEYYKKPIDEHKLWTFYDTVKSKIIPQTKGKDVLIWIRTDGDILKRKNDGFINIDNTNDFNRLNNGRMVEIHPEISYQKGDQWYSDIIFCDLDPQEKFDWKETKSLAKDIHNLFIKDTNVKKAEIKFSGSRGFHIIGKLRSSWEVNKARDYTKKLLKPLETDKIKIGLVKEKDMLRMDTTLIKKKGSLRAAYAMHRDTGLIAIPVDIKSLDKFEKKHAMVDKVIKGFSKKSFIIKKSFNLVSFKFDPNSTENEGRLRIRDPKDFKSKEFRRWTKWAGEEASKGVTFLVGELVKSDEQALQAIRFDRDSWTEKEAGKYWSKLKNKKGFKKTWKW